MFRIALLLSVDMFLLIAAIFLLVYISKNQLSKWFTYGAVAIVITIITMMICSVCCSVCMRHCSQGAMQNECSYEENCPQQMMGHGMQMGHCSKMMGKGDCCKEMKECKMDRCEDGDDDDGECEEKKECNMTKTVIITKDSMPHHEMMKKK